MAKAPSLKRKATAGRPRIERRGLRTGRFNDVYHFLLTTSWFGFFGLIGATYLGANLVFAALYFVVPGSLESARSGSFFDCFFFSIQTMATIGYGKMTPAGLYANVLVTFESMVGILGVALVTGLTFSKFARPTARVLFSKVCVVSKRDGVRSLMFRMANERATQIVDVNLHFVLTIDDTTEEGESIRRFHTLALTRSRAATFALSWTAIHPVTPDSPLFNMTADELARRRAGLMVSLTGIDETFAQTVHARFDWPAASIAFKKRFADILTESEAGRVIDYAKFHDVIDAD